MVSTFLSYRMYAADFDKSVQRTLSNTQVAREQAYYKENIGKVKSIDDFLNDDRLYRYAMKAHGLEDMTYAKAFMRKVLESDVTDSASFVRKLVDQRYLAFAQAFNFDTDGNVSTGKIVVQDKSDQAEVIGLYSEQRVRKGTAVAAEVEYYQARMATITSAHDFVSDPRLFEFALTAYGIDASIASESAIKAVISGDLSGVAASPDIAKYQKLAAAFSFAADGTAPAGQAQTASQITQTIYLNYDASGAGASPAAAGFKTNLYTSQMQGVTSVDDLLNNSMLLDYALTAVGLDPVLTSPVVVREVLTGDLSDPDSVANSKPEYAKLAALFNFNADGSLDAGVAAQTIEQEDELINGYLANYQSKAASEEAADTSDYKFAIGLITSVDDLVKDTRLFNYVLEALGLDPTQETPAKIKRVLTSDLSSATSFARLQRDERYVQLAEAFNFSPDGQAQGPLQAQYSSSKQETIALYTSKLGPYDHQKAAGEVESQYYSSLVDTVETVDQLLADKRAVDYLKKAYGFERETIHPSTLRQVLTSDVNDPKSFVNQPQNVRFKEMAKAFNFDADGNAKRVVVGLAQDAPALAETQDMYVRQTMEQTAGEENEGVRLALYFQRKAPELPSAMNILADKAVLEVVMTTLGIPDSAAQADVDVLVKMIESRLDVADFKDPAKLDKFLAKFAALYDLENQQSSGTNIPSLLLGQEQNLGISESLLSSIQALKFRV